jgi:hypothetical protein
MTERSTGRSEHAIGTATVALGLTALGLAGAFTYAAAVNAAAGNSTPAATIVPAAAPRGESDDNENRGAPAASVQAAPTGSRPVAVSGGS